MNTKKHVLFFIMGIIFSLKLEGQLPSELPSNLEDLESANRTIAEFYAPTVHQMADTEADVSEGGLADLITSAFYDNEVFSDNWNNLPNYTSSELLPHVYYSVVWTDKTWIITYGFYHPRDYSISYDLPSPVVIENVCCADNHEHDFEGVIYVVNRNSNNVQIAATISHFDLYMDFNSYGMTPPDVYIDDRTHAVRLNMEGECIDEVVNPIAAAPCDGCETFEAGNHIVYTYAGGSQSLNVSPVADEKLAGTGTYVLEDIFGLHQNSFGNLRNNVSYFSNDKFLGLGDEDCEGSGSASAPWGWSQLTYSNEEILKLACASTGVSGFSLVGNSVANALGSFGPTNYCNDPLIYDNNYDMVLYNPYFETTSEGCNNSPEDVTIVVISDEDWNGLLIENQGDQFKSVVVRNSSTLTIESYDMRMLLPGTITVESGSTLILDNSNIRPCDPDTRWRGIFLENGASIELKNNSSIKKSRLGIYNNSDLNSLISFEGAMDLLSIYYSISESAGNNTIIINNSTLEDNFNSLTIDGDNNTIIIENDSYIKSSNYGTMIRGNENGTFEYNDSHFDNNTVSLLAYKCGDKNSIYNCDFVNDSEGYAQVELREVDGLDFQMNKMDGTGSLFSAIASHVDIINGNEFINSSRAIYVGASAPLFSSATIGSIDTDANFFDGNGTGIRLSGLNSPQRSKVINNRIENADDKGIDIYGKGLYSLINNTVVDAKDGIYFSNSGSAMINSINCNKFEDNLDQDLCIELDNSRTLFLQNDFSDSDSKTNILLSQASVWNQQGTIENPSDNCFDSSAEMDMFTDNNTDHFDYFHNENITCRIPLSGGNYNGNGTQSNGDNCDDDIGSNFVDDDPDLDGDIAQLPYPFPNFPTPGVIGSNTDDALNRVLSVGGDNPYTYIDESLTNTAILPNQAYPISYLDNIQAIYDNEVELDYWIKAGIYYAVQNEDYAYGENLLLPYKKWRWQEMLVGLYMKSKQYTKARALLTSLPSNTQYEAEFKALEHINLDRLLHGENSITPSQTAVVHTIATGTTPAVGYAIPLYYILTGIHIQTTVPTRGSNPRSVASSENRGINIVPNPVMDNLSIVNLGAELIGEVQILDQYNRVQLSISADNLDNVDVSILATGWYILKGVTEDDEIVTVPFIKQ